MYYTKPDFYFIVFGCICLLTFLAIVFLNPKSYLEPRKTEPKATSRVELKEAVDDLSQKLEKIRELMQKQEEREKECK